MTLKNWLHGLLVFCLLVILYTLAVRAQEKDPAYPATRSWVLGTYDRLVNPDYKNRIVVIDTAGVCLYLMEAAASNWAGVQSQLVAVPKTQLLKGTGCQ